MERSERNIGSYLLNSGLGQDPCHGWRGLSVRRSLREGDVLAEERLRRGGVQAVVDVGGAAHGVAGDGDRGHEVGFGGPGTEEVRTARVAIAGAAVAAGRVYRDPQPARVDRQQPA